MFKFFLTCNVFSRIFATITIYIISTYIVITTYYLTIMGIKEDAYLMENGINPSYQRVKIIEYLLKKRNHPTIDMIFRDLKKEMPRLSKTTIYNTLKLFIEKNIVKPLTIEDNILRYDAETNLHGHFKCNKCGTIVDVNLNSKNIDTHVLKNFTITEQHFYFQGNCKKKSCSN